MKGKTQQNGKTGFTLIELLIVVAIIAILAAIAVPNFLEAQVRSKVSRAHADMRSIATALETYAVDHRRVPLGPWDLQAIGHSADQYATPDDPTGWYNYTMQIYSVLTTPIAYMSSIPRDPFRDKGSVSKTGTADPNSYWYTYQSYSEKMAGAVEIDKVLSWGYTWSLRSAGPFRHSQANEIWLLTGVITSLASHAQVIYDPSNGTVSAGIIMRTNKGITKGPKM